MAEERLSAVVGARISEFKRKMAEVNRTIKSLPNNTVIRIKADTKRGLDKIDLFQQRMETLANSIRTFGTIAGSVFRGFGIAVSSAAVPIIATLIPAIMAAGNALGVLGGGMLALGSSFTAAGVGMAGFTAVAIPSITHVLDLHKEVKAAMDAAAKAKAEGNAQAYQEAIAQLKHLREASTKEQQLTLKALNKFEDFWHNYWYSLDGDILQIFRKSMDMARSVLEALRPAVETSIKAVSGLFDSFNQSLEAPDVKAIIAWLNASAAPALTAISKSVGNLMRGFFSLMKAFNPLAVDMQNGLVGMTERFAEWAAGLSKSDKFNKFMDYVRTNLPVIGKIFGDIFTGIINLFASFGDNSELIFKKLAEMTGKFKTWSENIKASDGFQQFIQYVQENGPKVIDLIGNVVTFIINLGKALAPLGSKMLDIINKVIRFSNSLMENHPIVGKIIAILTVLVGSLMALTPLFIALQIAFGGFVGKMLTGFAKILGKAIAWSVSMAARFVMVAAKMAWFVAKFLFNAARIAAGWLIAMGPIGWVITAVVALVALIIWKWDEVKAFTLKAWDAIVQGIKVAWEWLKETASSVFSALGTFFSDLWNSIKETASSTWNGIKTFLSDLWTSVKETAVSIWEGLKTAASATWQAIVDAVMFVISPFVQAAMDIFNSMKSGITNVFEGIKSFFTNIWEIIKNIFAGALLLLIDLVTGDFERLKTDALAIWENLKNAFKGLWDAIKQIFSGALEAIWGLATKVWNDIKSVTSSVWEGIKSFFSTTWEFLKTTAKNAGQAILDFVKQRWENLKSNTTAVFNAVKSFFKTTWETLKTTAKNAGQAILDFLKQCWENLKRNTTTVFNAVKNFFTDTWNAIKRFFTETLGELLSKAKQKFQDIVNAVKEKMNAAQDKIETIWNDVVSFFENIDLKQIGKDIIQGLINGIGSMASSITNKVKEVAGAIPDKIREFLGIASPSKVTMQLGEYTGEGLAKGIDRKVRDITAGAKRMAAAAVPSIKTPDMGYEAGITMNPVLASGSINTPTIRTPYEYDKGSASSAAPQPEPVYEIHNTFDGDQMKTSVNKKNTRESRMVQGMRR